jgi:hypothetical protein
MSKTHLVLPDPHAHPEFNNNRADLVSSLIYDLKPDHIINMGDLWDFPSLSSYDKGTKNFVGKNYQLDVVSGIEFNDRMFHKIKKQRKKKPHSTFLWGNHEFRLEKAIQIQPELEGHRYGISKDDLQLGKYYEEVVEYEGNTPGITSIDGVSYSHYFASGGLGRPIGGDHHAASLISKNYTSCTAAHSHSVDYAVRSVTGGKKIHGLVAGVFQDYDTTWAGAINEKWWRGLVICHNVEDGMYDPEFVSMERLRKEYGN